MLTDTNITSTASVLRALLSAKYRSRHARKLKIRCSSPWWMAYANGARSRLVRNGSLNSSFPCLGDGRGLGPLGFTPADQGIMRRLDAAIPVGLQ